MHPSDVANIESKRRNGEGASSDWLDATAAWRSLPRRLRNPQSTRAPRHIAPCCTSASLTAIMSDSTTQPIDSSMEVNEELDPSVENEIIPDATQPDAMNLDGTNDAEPPTTNGVPEVPATFEARIPAKKDATLREFLGNMDEYAPIVCIPARHVRLGLADQATDS
jgi:hypothetical protein